MTHLMKLLMTHLSCALVVGLLPVPASAQDAVARGEKVFAAQKCTVCHAVGDKGNKKGPLDGVGSKHSADEIRQWILNAPEMAAKANAQRKPPMKAFTTIPKTDLDDLVAYLESLKKG
jgi:mono/diheme cytochrome c family protein